MQALHQNPPLYRTLLSPFSKAIMVASPTAARHNHQRSQAAAAAPSPPPQTKKKNAHKHEVYLAFGSNLGDRLSHIQNALDELEAATLPPAFAPGSVHVCDTSALYESLPMYYHDQGRFVNGVIKASTGLSALELLQAVKYVEHHIGRRKTINNGPREVDLDILLYDDQVIEDAVNDLIVPHQRISEREFVLRPLSDLIPHRILPRFHQSPLQLLQHLDGPSELTRMNPLTAAGFAGIPKVLILDESSKASAPSEKEVIVCAQPSSSSSRNTQELVTSLRKTQDARTVIALDGLSGLRDGATWVSADLSHSTTSDRVEVWRAMRKSRQALLLDARNISRGQLASVLKEALHHGVRRWQMVILGGGPKQQAEHGDSITGSVPWVFSV